MPKNAFAGSTTRDLLISPKTTQRHFLFTPHPLSTVIFATATEMAFVLLRSSNFNFHCYTEREATPTQKSARKCAATSRDFFREQLQSAFTLANQLRWIAQYLSPRTLPLEFLFLLKGYGSHWPPKLSAPPTKTSVWSCFPWDCLSVVLLSGFCFSVFLLEGDLPTRDTTVYCASVADQGWRPPLARVRCP